MSYTHRQIKDTLLEALRASPVVFLGGPRQAGKSTLAQHIAKDGFPAHYVTLDSATQMAAAAHAPEHYLSAREGALIIDEVQLVPALFRALKVVVDEARQKKPKKAKGQFLLTGSAGILALPQLADALVGRMRVLTLYPLSATEVLRSTGGFIDQCFQANFQKAPGKARPLDLIELIGRATFPEISGASPKARRAWFDNYITTLLQRDVRALAEIEKLSALPNLLRILASRAGGLVNDADIARSSGLSHMTTRNYKTLLKMLFLTFDVTPWYRNIGKRLVKSPKGYLTDTLLLCHLLQYKLEDIEKNRPELFGQILENFVATELIKLIAAADTPVQLHHFRSSDHKEVDFVLEKPSGQLTAIEIKARDRLDASDFQGLTTLQQLTGKDFVCGIVLYRGKDIVPFGPKQWAVPLNALWQ